MNLLLGVLNLPLHLPEMREEVSTTYEINMTDCYGLPVGLGTNNQIPQIAMAKLQPIDHRHIERGLRVGKKQSNINRLFCLQLDFQ